MSYGHPHNPYVKSGEERIAVRRLACWGHSAIPTEDGERCLLCGRELDQRALAWRYRLAKSDQAELGISRHLWMQKVRQEAREREREAA